MGRPRQVRADGNAMATIWTISDEGWDVIAPLLAEVDPPKRTGRPRVDARRTLDAILFRLRTGRHWCQLPARFPDDSAVHRPFQRWVQLGLFARLWATLVAAGAEWGGVDWEWQAADAMRGKARLGGRAHSARSRQTWGEAEPAGRGGLRPAGSGERWGERAGHQPARRWRAIPSSSRAPSPRVSGPSSCVWTWATTPAPRPRPRPWRATTTSRNCAASARSSSPRASRASPPAAGESSAPTPGSSSAARCSSGTTGTTNGRPISWRCSSLPAPCSGFAASIAYPF